MMNRIKVLVALLFLACMVQAQTALDQAKNLITNENYGEAGKVLTQYIASEKDPLKQAEAYYWIGESLYRDLADEKNMQPAFDKSKEQFNKGIAIAKNSPHCLVGMGKLLLDAKNTKEALKTFDSAIKESRKKPFKEGTPEIFMLVGDAFLNGVNKNPEQAVAYYTRARDIEPINAKTWIKLGDGSLAKNDAGTAMNAYESATTKDPKNVELYLKRSKIWRRSNKMELAQKELEDGLKIDPKYALIYKDLIELYMDTKQFNKVLPALEKYIPLAGNDFSARRRLVTFLTYQARDYDRSIVEAEKLLKDDPTQTTMYRWIAWSKCAKADTLVGRSADSKVLGDDAKMLYTESREASKKLFEVVPADRLVYYDFEFPAKASLKLGELDEATKYYKMVMANDSTKTCDIYASLIQANYANRKIKEGLELLEEKDTKCENKTKYNDYYYAFYYAYFGRMYDKSILFADKFITEFTPNIKVVDAVIDAYGYKGLSLTQQDSETAPEWKAKANYEKMVSIYEEKPEERAKAATTKTAMGKAYNYLATYAASTQDLVKAKDLVAKALKMDPVNKNAVALSLQLGGN
jgi:tetratricopeptide (TPR) repeat protein